MKRPILFLLSLLMLATGCDVDPVDRPVVSESGRDYVWCQVGEANYLADGLSVSLNAALDTAYLVLDVRRVYGPDNGLELKSIEMRVARKDLVPQRRIGLDEEQARIAFLSGATALSATDVTGYVLFWKCADQILAGQFEFQCSSAPYSFYISHGMFDLKAPFVL